MANELYQITDKLDSRKIAEFLSKDGQLLLPLLELICNTEQALDELIDVVGKGANGIIGGAYWSVVGPGKNLQLTVEDVDYRFRLPDGTMHLADEEIHPARLPEPVTLVGPANGAFVDVNGAVFSSEESENAVSYQLLFGPDPHRVMDYYIISDTPNPPTQVLTASFFTQTWWTIKVRDQYGSTIYADPIRVEFENLEPSPIENITIGKEYGSCQQAIDDAQNGNEIVVRPGLYRENINFKGKNLTIRSIDTTVVAAAVINGSNLSPVVTFSSGEDPNCVLAGFTITGGKRGILCSGSSPTISNCIITGNSVDSVGGGIYCEDDSNPNISNCTINRNSAIVGGAIGGANSNPVLTNCILWGNMSDEIFVFGGAAMITHSDIQGGCVGEGNIDVDPLFADPSNGDYHLKSQAGRWDSLSESWGIDDVTSPCIDAGDPNSPIADEPEPNGGRINMGAYGGTVEASKSP